MRWLLSLALGPIIRIAYGIHEAGAWWEIYRDTVRRRGEVETVSRKVLSRCDSQQEAESEMGKFIRKMGNK